MTRANHIPARVSLATEKRLQAAVLDLLMGTGPHRPQQKRNGRYMAAEDRIHPEQLRAVAHYMALCRQARVRLERAA
jgi:hypothetical protein